MNKTWFKLMAYLVLPPCVTKFRLIGNMKGYEGVFIPSQRDFPTSLAPREKT